jgi:hypothetical protein
MRRIRPKDRPLKPFSSQHRCTGRRTSDTAAASPRTGTGSCSITLDCSIGLRTSGNASAGGNSFRVVALTNRTLSVTLGAGASALGFPSGPDTPDTQSHKNADGKTAPPPARPRTPAPPTQDLHYPDGAAIVAASY